MRRERFVLTLLVTVLLLYYFIPFEWLGPTHGKYFVHPQRPAILNERCQYLEIPVTGKEGEYDDAFFTLRGLVLVFRHGERSPVTQVKNNLEPECAPHFDIDRRAFRAYSTLVNSEPFREFLLVDRAFPKEYEWLPHSSECKLGKLTAEGALQHLRLGSYLHDKYKLQGLLDGIQDTQISVISSMYMRTFQSAIAFCSAFLYPLEKLKSLTLNASNTTHFCVDNEHSRCACPKYDQIRKKSEMERVDEFQTKTPSQLRERIRRLGEMVGMDAVRHPLEFLDVILGRYACRRALFPCDGDDCLTLYDILQAADEGVTIANRMFRESSPTTRTMIAVETFALLEHITAVIRRAREKPRGANQIAILSGHDITLEALVRSLNLDTRTPPHYASRASFEIFESRTKVAGEQLFIRILFNGVDQTNRVPFCTPLVKGLCPASRFAHFGSRGVFNMAEIEGLSDVC